MSSPLGESEPHEGPSETHSYELSGCFYNLFQPFFPVDTGSTATTRMLRYWGGGYFLFVPLGTPANREAADL
jgi:hypothetical protein